MSERFSPRNLRKLVQLIVLVVLLILAAIEAFSGTSVVPPAVLKLQPGEYSVSHVSDGDTIKVTGTDGQEQTVRLIGVDTPETVDRRKSVQCYGPEASAHTKQVLTGAKVRLAPDPDDSDTDKYGRLLRYVYLTDGTLYNRQLIEQGYGFAYVVFDFSRIQDFAAAETTAKNAGTGLWSKCNVDESKAIKQTTSPR